MASNKIFTSGENLGSPDFALQGPITEEKLSALISDPKKIKWHYLAEFHHYDPYLVKVTDLGLDTGDLTFQFIDCDTAKPMNGTHRIKMSNWPLVYAAMPSTVPTKDQFDAGQNISFLMLNPNELAGEMRTEALASNAGPASGKWPGGSPEELMLVQNLRSSIRELLKLVPNGVLPSAKREKFELQSAES